MKLDGTWTDVNKTIQDGFGMSPQEMPQMQAYIEPILLSELAPGFYANTKRTMAEQLGDVMLELIPQPLVEYTMGTLFGQNDAVTRDQDGHIIIDYVVRDKCHVRAVAIMARDNKIDVGKQTMYFMQVPGRQRPIIRSQK